MRHLRWMILVLCALSPALAGGIVNDPEDGVAWSPDIPAELTGPYVLDPATLAELDHGSTDPTRSCRGAGPLNFQCLVYRDARSKMSPRNLASNPFMLHVFDKVRSVVTGDLTEIASNRDLTDPADEENTHQLSPEFLVYPGATIELVGVINRMDRQFNPDRVPEHGRPASCGEISAIYRFAYRGDGEGAAGQERSYGSRLPVTMNVVFPAAPWSGAPDCTQVARRWMEYMRLRRQGADPAIVRRQALQVVSSLKPMDVDRIELNMQGSRMSASSSVANDFGTLATYVIRVFRWVPQTGYWEASYLKNQIDRARVLGNAHGDGATCLNMRDVPVDRGRLVNFLTGTALTDVDKGLHTIPIEFLACRAISVSPGGASRSINQPFWNAPVVSEQVISDQEIDIGLRRYSRSGGTLRYVQSADDFRTRLNDATCSGCHQSRAIAGFHMPGADRPGTSPINAVFLPGSPHFFGDQARRAEIVAANARGRTPGYEELVISYAARPLARYSALAPERTGRGIQLNGGWGSACLMPNVQPSSRRKWSCAGGMVCRAVFSSRNQPGMGVCVNPQGRTQIGEAMQQGVVTSERFGRDFYARVPPVPRGTSDRPRDTTIRFDERAAPSGNSFFAAHQEYYGGIPRKGEGVDRVARLPGESEEDQARRIRDQGTGGFPAGSLRLSECAGLPDEATCALLASTGFNTCLEQATRGYRTPESCFRLYTSYAGVRACDPANPCRDDYICLAPMGYTAANAIKRFDERRQRRAASRSTALDRPEQREGAGVTYFGEGMPDAAWLARNGGRGDRRGVCIPPYFVFQFKADGHRVPRNYSPILRPLAALEERR